MIELIIFHTEIILRGSPAIKTSSPLLVGYIFVAVQLINLTNFYPYRETQYI